VASGGRKNADEALALALATGQTLACAAQAAGVSERTAARRWAGPAFRRRVSELQSEVVARAQGKTADGMAEAADVLRALLSARSDTVKLGACRALLEMGTRIHESVNLTQRMAAVETALGKQLQGNPDVPPE
jgi:hypothetical protein